MNLIYIKYPNRLSDIGYRSPGDLVYTEAGGVYLILLRSYLQTKYAYDVFSIKRNVVIRLYANIQIKVT